MGVNPGFGGQTFIPGTLKKIADLKNRLENRKLSTLIQVDGGVNLHTIRNISMAGTDVFVAGSAIFESRNYRETIDQFRKAIIG
jgi:ribulose-phosphate 3-epimerase